MADFVAETMFSSDSTPNRSPQFRRFIARNRDNIPAAIESIDDAIRYIRTSITAKRLNLVKKEDIGTGEGTAHPAWNIFIHPPTSNHLALIEWRQSIRTIVFFTDMNGAGRAARPFNCTVCRSIAHPSGMCPYPTQRGWIPPLSDPSPALDALLNPAQATRANRTNAPRGSDSRPSNRGRNANVRRGRNSART